MQAPRYKTIDSSYVEEQDEVRCGGHALNNLFQNDPFYKAYDGPLFLTHCTPDNQVWNKTNKTFNLCNLCNNEFTETLNFEGLEEDPNYEDCEGGNNLKIEVLQRALNIVFKKDLAQYQVSRAIWFKDVFFNKLSGKPEIVSDPYKKKFYENDRVKVASATLKSQTVGFIIQTPSPHHYTAIKTYIDTSGPWAITKHEFFDSLHGCVKLQWTTKQVESYIRDRSYAVLVIRDKNRPKFDYDNQLPNNDDLFE